MNHKTSSVAIEHRLRIDEKVSTQMKKEFIETSIAERHDYTRQIFALAVTWFTFFITVNYAAMGWLAPNAHKIKNALYLIAAPFLVQNTLGVIVCLRIRSHFADTDNRIAKLQDQLMEFESPPTAPSSETAMPLRFYSICLNLMIITLGTIMIAWCILPFLH
jgi:hypothetical protein